MMMVWLHKNDLYAPIKEALLLNNLLLFERPFRITSNRYILHEVDFDDEYVAVHSPCSSSPKHSNCQNFEVQFLDATAMLNL